METINKINEIIIKQFGAELLKYLDLEPLNQNIDSLSFVQLLVQIEQEFDIIFDDEYLNMDNFQTYSSLCEYVTKLVEKK